MTKVVQIRLKISNAYLLIGERPVLVDTGSPDETATILAALEKESVTPGQLSLILHTHGHPDHAGNSLELSRLSKAAVAIHAADETKLRTGRNGELKPTRLEARVVKPFVDRPFEGLQADLLVEDGGSLGNYGVNARIMHTPGHTAGSISILTDDCQVIVGDLMMGGYLGGAILPQQPNYHYFAKDLFAVRRSIVKIIATDPARFYVGHGGPLEAVRVRQRFEGDLQN